jgi:exodeoxyribonuclease V alpha subunit
MSQERLSPLGAARERFLKSKGHVFERSSEPVLPARLLSAAEGFELDDAVLYQAWELARCAPGLDSGERTALLFLGAAALVGLRRGSTRLPLDAANLSPLLESLGANAKDIAAVGALLDSGLAGGPASAVIGRPEDYKPFVVDEGSLYLQRMRAFEDRLVEALRKRIDKQPSAAPARVDEARVDQALAQVLAAPTRLGDGTRIELSDEQQKAVRTALLQPLAVISGGPGTGKTSVVVSILRALARLGVSMKQVALAAPTGKAANRMEEAIRKSLRGLDPEGPDADLLKSPPEARTLHRLLGYLPTADRFRHHDGNPLAEEVVIVDEGSMVDLFLMTQLVSAVRRDARLILLGDAEQLPSVDAGAVLRDLIPGEGADDARSRCAARLKKSFRMSPTDPSGRAVLSFAQATNEGQADKALGLLQKRGSTSELKLDMVELLAAESPTAREAFLGYWFEEQVCRQEGLAELVRREYRFLGEGEKQGFGEADTKALETLFGHFESFKLLCVTRGDARASGVASCNAWMHRRWAEDEELGSRAPQAPGNLLPGEPVMVLQNDYSRGLFNGDQGIVLRVALPGEASHSYRAVFPTKDGFKPFGLEGLRSKLQLSFAMTVHKSQGSELDHVALMLPEREMPLLTREILYTAVTRARKSVAIVGAESILRQGIERRMERFSGIGERLAKPAQS